MTSPIDIEALKAERREELIKLIDYHARITVGDYGLSAELDNADEIADAILASEDSLIARTEAAEGEVKRQKNTRWSAQIHADSEARIAELVAQRDGLVEIATKAAERFEGLVEGCNWYAKLERKPDSLDPTGDEAWTMAEEIRAALSTIKAGGGADV